MQVILATDAHRSICVDIADKVLNAGRAISECFDSDNCFIGVTEGGFVAAMVNVDTADLLDIAVLPQYRRSGKADALMAFLQNECRSRGVSEIFLEVRESNTPAISLYAKHSYERISVRKKYYSNPTEDAVIMRKTL